MGDVRVCGICRAVGSSRRGPPNFSVVCLFTNWEQNVILVSRWLMILHELCPCSRWEAAKLGQAPCHGPCVAKACDCECVSAFKCFNLQPFSPFACTLHFLILAFGTAVPHFSIPQCLPWSDWRLDLLDMTELYIGSSMESHGSLHLQAKTGEPCATTSRHFWLVMPLAECKIGQT